MKRFLAMFLMVIMMFSLVACGEKSEEAKETVTVIVTVNANDDNYTKSQFVGEVENVTNGAVVPGFADVAVGNIEELEEIIDKLETVEEIINEPCKDLVTLIFIIVLFII